MEERPKTAVWVDFCRVILKDLVRTMMVEWWRVFTVAERNNTNGGALMNGLVLDVRTAIRSLCRRPGFLIIVLGTLGLGVGATTTVHSVVHGVLFKPLPYENPRQIVRVGKISEGRAGILSVSALDLRDLQERNRSFTALAASRPTNMTLSGESEPELVRVAMVSSQFFDVLGRFPSPGRFWSPDADEPGGVAVVVLGNGIWQRRWGSDPNLVGRSISLSGTAFTVVGIMPEGFVPPEALFQRGTEAWIPLAFLNPETRIQRGSGFLQLIGRLRPGVTIRSARDELAALGAEISSDHPGPGERSFGLSPLHDETVGDADESLLPLLAAVGLLLTIACINAANLLLVRANERAAEIALRSCLGAARSRLVRYLMTESTLLGLAAGVLGSIFGAVGVWGFAAYAPPQLPRVSEITLSVSVLFYAAAIAAATSIFFGFLPAVRGSSTDLSERLGGGRGRSWSRGEVRIRDILVVAETALSIVLVVCGGLLFNSLLRVVTVDPGFKPDGVGVVAVLYPEAESPGEISGFFKDVVDRIAQIPGVRAAGATVNLPLSGNKQMLRINAPGLVLSADDEEQGGFPVNYQQVTPGYFETMSIALLRGRHFERTDDANAPRVAIVNQAMARRLFTDARAVGHRLTLGDDPDGSSPIEIVGVVADTRQEHLDAGSAPELYLPFEQLVARRMEIVARGKGSGADLLPAMRNQVWAVRPDLPVRRSAAMTQLMDQSVSSRRFIATVIGGFSLLALSLAAVGVYGTLASAVSQRRRELGVRLALGATGGSVLRAVLLQSTRTVTTGIVIGVVVSLFAARVLESLLFGITSRDPLTLALAITVVLGASTVASFVPARKAAKVDPMISLRTD